MRGKRKSDISRLDPFIILIQNLNWKLVENYIFNRIRRLKKINQCPIIYVGSAGTHKGSKNTLKGRYEEFSRRHTAMYPIWVLLY